MKRIAVLLMLILTVALLAACKAPETKEEDPLGASGDNLGVSDGIGIAPPGDPTPTPTITPEPTITARPVVMAVETAAPNATPPLIDPIDKPTRTPINVKYSEYLSNPLGISFNVPTGWAVSLPNENAIQFVEPELQAHDDYPTRLLIQVIYASANQTDDDEKAELESIIESLRAEYPNIEVGPVGDNNAMLGEYGLYVNIRIPQENGMALRGRVFVLAKNRRLYQVRYICPGNYNSDYTEVYREIRNSMKEL